MMDTEGFTRKIIKKIKNIKTDLEGGGGLVGKKMGTGETGTQMHVAMLIWPNVLSFAMTSPSHASLVVIINSPYWLNPVWAKNETGLRLFDQQMDVWDCQLNIKCLLCNKIGLWVEGVSLYGRIWSHRVMFFSLILCCSWKLWHISV